ncbi:MAG: Gfo/Idh/MocA family protein [Verrucomicrobiales bacterium]
MSELKTPSRRQILKTGSTLGAAALAGFPHIANAQAGNNETIKIGIVGCGGRGTGALTQALSADENTKLWAIGDAFDSQVQNALKNTTKFGERSKVPAERQFTGLEAFQQVIDSGVDLVILTAPPAFRPQHLRAAVEAGKHTFCEKPMAVDMAGIHSVLESAKIAKQKNLAIQHGFCWRAHPETRELYKKIHDGELGRVISINGNYLASPVKPLPVGTKKPEGMGDVEFQIRWWFNFEWLSAGPLVEQCIHTVDKVAWAMGDIAPIAAYANGGKIGQDHPGNIYDHYNVTYEYPGGVFAHVNQRHFVKSYTNVSDAIQCEGGTGIAPGRCAIKDKDGKITWRSKPIEGENNMYQVEHNELFAGLRAGKIINAGEYMANSTALGLLGREAAHTGQRITWEQLFKSQEDKAPDDLKMEDDFPIAPVPRPGTYQLG